MLKRRDLILGLPLLAAAGGAFALTPRNRLNLLGDKKLEKAVPLKIGSWSVTPSNAVILPDSQPGSLSARLYDHYGLKRIYYSAFSPIPVTIKAIIAVGGLFNLLFAFVAAPIVNAATAAAKSLF